MNTSLLASLESLTIGYPGRSVVHGLSMDVERGRFVAVAGPNGSGKTTLIRTILGILPALSGRVRLHGTETTRPILGYVPQRESLDPRFLLNSFEIALMGVCGRVGPIRRIGKAEKEWTRHCLDLAGAAELGHLPFASLSGGQRQRVLIARGLAVKPDWLLLDEPTSGLDAAASQGIMDLLNRLPQPGGMAVWMVNHNLAQVRSRVQDVVWLADGRGEFGPADRMLSPDKIEAMLSASWR